MTRTLGVVGVDSARSMSGQGHGPPGTVWMIRRLSVGEKPALRYSDLVGEENDAKTQGRSTV